MQLKVNLPVSIFKEGRQFVAYTPALDLSTSAKTYEDAKKRFGEVVQIFFEHTLKRGALEEVLVGLGWKKIKKQWTPPTVVSQGIEEIKVPMSV